MSKYKLIASDFDDTLVPMSKVASARTIQAIHNFINGGGYFTISSGRMVRGLINNMGNIPVNAPIIAYGGGRIVDLTNGEIVFNLSIDNQTSLELLSVLIPRHQTIFVYIDDLLYAEQDNDILKLYSQSNKIEYNLVYNLYDYVKNNNCVCNKVLIVEQPEQAKIAEQTYIELFNGKLDVVRSSARSVEFAHPNAQKGIAVSWLADRLGIKQQEIICFGDSINDISMIKYAGLGVAVSNAMPQVKDIADLICDSAEDDGVAKVIESIL
ncbi:MAG: HAD family hydrolase [Clostridia bacterium]|nr:HAD family hydrolase [Clostridia bacterium]